MCIAVSGSPTQTQKHFSWQTQPLYLQHLHHMFNLQRTPKDAL